MTGLSTVAARHLEHAVNFSRTDRYPLAASDPTSGFSFGSKQYISHAPAGVVGRRTRVPARHPVDGGVNLCPGGL